MSFNYHKNNGQHSGDSFWTSYSDLFLGLSCIFLLLYVVSSMRQGADTIQQQVVNEQLETQVNDLKNQLKAYEEIKNQYMKDEASKDEKQEYNELVDKLSLLQEENISENDKLKKELLANQKKGESLNKYQQMVRNMLNANKLAKTKINTREVVIEEKSQVISEKEQQVATLEKEVQENQHMIAQGEKQIKETKAKLDERLKQLRNAYKAQKITKASLEKKIAQANQESQQTVKALQNEKAQYQQELNGVTQKLKAVASNLDETKGMLEKKTGEAAMLQNKVVQTAQEAEAKIAGMRSAFGTQQAKMQQDAEAKIAGLKNAFGAQQAKMAADAEARIAGMKGQFADQQAKEKAAFEGELGKLKLGAAEREKREGAFRAAAAEKEREMNNQMAGLAGQLAKAKAEIEARQAVAKDIRKSFANAGIKAEVNDETGEVVLDFGQSYFDSGSAQLKQEMKAVIEKAVPVYAKSLLGNAKVSDKVSAVEIIGFASPTYKGRFVDPKSNNKEDQEALKYNMDLSYSRAKSIFNYIVDNQKDQSPTQKSLMSLMKVSGRSFLEVAKVKDVSPQDFCKVNDCKKAQRVVIRFSMDKK
jgi:outer membrane protein OmpA-like peptidoglycan-associated protein